MGWASNSIVALLPFWIISLLEVSDCQLNKKWAMQPARKFSHFPWRLVRRSGLIQGGKHFFLVDFLNSGFSLVFLKNTFCHYVSHTLCKGASYHCGDRNDENFFTCRWWTCLSFGQCRLRLWCDKFVCLNLDQRGDPNVSDLLAVVQNEWNSSFKAGLICFLHKRDNSPVACPIRAMMLWFTVSVIMLALVERLSQHCRMAKVAFWKACWYYQTKGLFFV